MALFHFSVTQIKRSAGKSAISSAAYISGRKLRSEYYGEYADYRRKGDVVHHEILLPPQAPKEYADQETLWSAVEFAEKNKRAQLAYSFNITLQNELTAQENHALTVRFIQENFLSRGMIADFAIHDPDREGEEANPHFHVMCPIRPLNPDGSWGAKQHREYVLDENGERVRDAKGKYVFNAVPTTDWGKPETLEAWRKAWCDLCNEAFEKKGLSVRIDNRSYLRQGIDQIPTVHEGPLVRQMESRGIPTEKGEKNRWIKATNALIRGIAGKIKAILSWMAEIKAALNEKLERGPMDYLGAYQTTRMAGACTQKAKVKNLKDYARLSSFVMAHKLSTMDDMAAFGERIDSDLDALKQTMSYCATRKKELKDWLNWGNLLQTNQPVMAKLSIIHFKGARERYAQEHEHEIKLYRMAKRKLGAVVDVTKPLPVAEWEKEIEALERTSKEAYAQFQPLREEAQTLWTIKYQVQKVLEMEAKGSGRDGPGHSQEVVR